MLFPSTLCILICCGKPKHDPDPIKSQLLKQDARTSQCQILPFSLMLLRHFNALKFPDNHSVSGSPSVLFSSQREARSVWLPLSNNFQGSNILFLFHFHQSHFLPSLYLSPEFLFCHAFLSFVPDHITKHCKIMKLSKIKPEGFLKSDSVQGRLKNEKQEQRLERETREEKAASKSGKPRGDLENKK